MKAILEFTLPEESAEFKLAQEGGDWMSAVEEYARWLRDICKYGEPENVEAHTFRDKLFEILGDRGLDLYD